MNLTSLKDLTPPRSETKQSNRTVQDITPPSFDQLPKLGPKTFGPGNVKSKIVFKTKKEEAAELESRTPSDIRNYFKIDMVEFLLAEENRNSSTRLMLQHFCLIKFFDRISGPKNQKFFSILGLSSKSKIRDLSPIASGAKTPKLQNSATRKKYRQSLMNADSFFKRILRRLWRNGHFSPRQANLAVCRAYVNKRGFDNKINICRHSISDKPSPCAPLTEDLSLILNCDLVLILKSFLSSSISNFLYSPMNISRYFANSLAHSEVKLNFSKHLSLQRKLLPFPAARASELRLAALTWNIAGKNMKKNAFVLTQICKRLIRSQPDLLVLGFQEIVELKMSFTNLKKIMFKCEEISLDIKHLVDEQVRGQFVCVSALNVTGILQLVYVHHSLMPAIDTHSFANWHHKFGGKAGFKMGNKGSVSTLIRLKPFGDLTFSNCHLTHGFDKVAKRVSKLKKMIVSIDEKRKLMGLDEESRRGAVQADFILGDFNMLVELSREEIQPIIYDEQNFQNNMAKIFNNEQLRRTMKNEKLLKDFKEHEIGRDLFAMFWNLRPDF